jgi:cysteinyl-tRNA synthetase, unknown class
MNKVYLFLSISLILFSCKSEDDETKINDIDYKQEMRDFVVGISSYSKAINTHFLIIPQNGIELVTDNGEEDGDPNTEYLNAIDGNGQEDLFYGYNEDDEATPNEDNSYLRSFLDISKNSGNTILVTDYCSSHSNMDDSYTKNNSNGYVSFAADQRELNHIPGYPTSVYNENNDRVTSLSQVRNFLYLINLEAYSTKTEFINAITSTNYDLLITDLFFNDGSLFTSSEVNQLKNKANGGTRLVISYMSIGEAEDYRYYWQDDWKIGNPSWLDAENPDWEGNYKVRYWEPEWQNIIFGNNSSYIKKILNAGFDGAYLDIIDAFEYFE